MPNLFRYLMGRVSQGGCTLGPAEEVRWAVGESAGVGRHFGEVARAEAAGRQRRSGRGRRVGEVAGWRRGKTGDAGAWQDLERGARRSPRVGAGSRAAGDARRSPRQFSRFRVDKETGRNQTDSQSNGHGCEFAGSDGQCTNGLRGPIR